MSDYYINKSTLPNWHTYYDSNGGPVDVELAYEKIDNLSPEIFLNRNYSPNVYINKYNTNTTMRDWILPDSRFGSTNNDNFSPTRNTSRLPIWNGTLPTFNLLQEIEPTGSNQIKIERTNTTLTIGSVTYGIDDFSNHAIPKSLLVELQASGGGGGSAWDVNYQYRGGGGGCAGSHLLVVLPFAEIIQSSEDESIYFGEPINRYWLQLGSGGQGGTQDSKDGKNGGNAIIRLDDGRNVCVAFGGYGGTKATYNASGTTGPNRYPTIYRYDYDADYKLYCFGIYKYSYYDGYPGLSGTNGGIGTSQEGEIIEQDTVTLDLFNSQVNNSLVHKLMPTATRVQGNFYAPTVYLSNGVGGGGGCSLYADGGVGAGATNGINIAENGTLGSGGGGGIHLLNYGQKNGGNGGDGFIKIYY